MKKNKVLSLILIIFLFLSLINVSFAQEKKFNDVTADKWYYDEVMQAYAEGIMVGTSETDFSPDTNVTREMFITALARTLEIDLSLKWYDPAYLFFDMNPKQSNYYFRSVMWGYTEGIVHGIGTEEKPLFGVGEYVTREQIATFIDRVLNNNYIVLKDADKAIEKFNDIPSKWAVNAVETMRKSGLIQGVGNNCFAGEKFATRAEVAAILLRFKNALGTASAKFDFSHLNVEKISIETFNGESILDDFIKYDIKDSEQIKQTIQFINEAKINKIEYIGTEKIVYEPFVYCTIISSDRISLNIEQSGSAIIYNGYRYIVEDGYFTPILELVK